ncbi:beta-galactosidase [Salibacterium halotolerans]|uniref:Beta-galactosidase n=1 Tax=Salibacterium halotolerans TaxID=1884432 RepID=A0A1I5Y8Z7_9BACI|nr:beta-galactosidase [Salibacterium halotolerans]SFQ40676.1 beta-galactosidase [Salibacterium halotolerans]
MNKQSSKIWFGGDYNPEQWEKDMWPEDIRMFKLAGIDVATLNVFSWALNQPDEITYNFEWLDEIMNKLYENGIYTCLATSTAAHPAWMAKKYPDILRVDFYGRKRKFGGRHNSCPNSTTYNKFAGRMAEKLSERYKDHPAVLMWHVSNEYGGYCYCENCAKNFRVWLKEKYKDLPTLNKAWNTRFWGHTFYEWDEIVPPNDLSEETEGQISDFQGISLDYRRFQSDSLLASYQTEYNSIRKHDSKTPITTNFMGLYPELNYFKWAPYLDVISWDNYPSIGTPVSMTAMTHDLMRGLKSGQPFMLMEQTPSQQNWQPYNSLKRPGVMRLWSYQAVAHGADTVMFFQLRRSIGATEKYHGAVIEHAGHEDTRVFKETAALGEELYQFSDQIVDSTITSKAAIVFDWENRWAIELSSGPTVALDYVEEIHNYYAAFFQQNISVDLISPSEDLSAYDIVVAPVLYMVKEGFADKLKRFTADGGTFITTFFSGIVNENDIVVTGGYPGELKDLLGIWVEEIDALPPEENNTIVLKNKEGFNKKEYTCNILYDIIHVNEAEIVADYGEDFYAGTPVVTKNNYGRGKAWYIGSSADADFISDLVLKLAQEKNIEPSLPPVDDVEVTVREKNNTKIYFILNHSNEKKVIETGNEEKRNLLNGQTIKNSVELFGKDLLILKE